MTDIAFFTIGLLAGTYVGLVCKKNNISIVPQTLEMGKYGAKGDI